VVVVGSTLGAGEVRPGAVFGAFGYEPWSPAVSRLGAQPEL